MKASDQSLARRLLDLQPEGCQITVRACQWAVRRAEGALGRTLISSDLDALGSKLFAPLLLLASTRTKRRHRWSDEHRWFAANELLDRLGEEGWIHACSPDQPGKRTVAKSAPCVTAGGEQ